MNRVDGRVWAASALLLVAIVMVLLLPKPRLETPEFDLAQIVPARFGDWRVDPSIVPIAPTPDVQANLERIYDQLLSRTYVNAQGQRVMLSIAYGGDQREALQGHLQEVCYRAQGFKVRGLQQDRIHLLGSDVPVTRLHALQGLRSEPVTYWQTMGSAVVSDRGERLLQQIVYGLRHRRVPDGMMVRVSSLDAEPQKGYALQYAFTAALLSAMDRADADRLLARSG
ncbi:MAG: exosortase-associated protein EpsI, B-type [Burkholderiaceae bacterium]